LLRPERRPCHSEPTTQIPRFAVSLDLSLLVQSLLTLIAIIASARLVGGLAVRWRQPRVGGEMVAGLAVGAGSCR